MHPTHPWMMRELYAERHRELEKRVARKRLMAMIPRWDRPGRLDQMRKSAGGMLIALGERLNPAERQTEGTDIATETASIKLAR